MADNLQQLINDQIDARRVGGGVLLPKGEFVVEKKLEIARVRGFKFGGQAPLATQLRWAGPDNEPMFLLDHCQDVLLEDFSITVADGKDLLAAAWIQNSPPPDEAGESGRVPNEDVPEAAAGPETSHVWWRNVRVIGKGRLTRGFHVRLVDPDMDEKNDHHTFEGVTVTGYKHAAFALEGRNAKNLGLDRCHCIGHEDESGERISRFAVDTAGDAQEPTEWNRGGAFSWSRGSVIAHAEADFRIGDRNDTIKIDGVYSEKGSRMLQMPDFGPGAGAACPVLLENYHFASRPEFEVPDGEVVQFESVGPLSMIACKLGANIKGQQFRIRYAPRPGPGAFVFSGNAVGNDGDGHVFTAALPTTPYETVNLGFRGGRWQPLGAGLWG
jgi:hypothetical protein